MPPPSLDLDVGVNRLNLEDAGEPLDRSGQIRHRGGADHSEANVPAR